MKRWILAALAMALLLTGWFVFRGDPDVRAIRKAFNALTEASQWEQSEDLLHAGLAARRVLSYCVKDIVFKVKDVPYTLSNRGELQAAIIHARTRADRLSLQITDTELELAPDRQTADMYVTARITVQDARETSSDLRSVKLLWKKTEQEWLLARVESFDTIDGS